MEKIKKSQVVSSLKEKIEKANGLLLTDFKGTNFVELSELRNKLKKIGGDIKIAKNTLLKIAIRSTYADELGKFLDGSNAVVFSYKDPVEVVKALVSAYKTQPLFKIKAGIMDGKILNVKDLEFVSKLPSKNELRGKLVQVIAGPLQGFVRVLSGPIRGLVIALNQIQKKKEAA